MINSIMSIINIINRIHLQYDKQLYGQGLIYTIVKARFLVPYLPIFTLKIAHFASIFGEDHFLFD